MSRSTAEWIGKTDDSAIPPRVRLRVFERAGGRCQGECGRILTPADKWQADHVTALINGGANRESNLRCICDWCHKPKTAEDVAIKAKTYAVRSKHVGVKKRSGFQTNKNGAFKKRMDGSVVKR